MFHTMYIQVKVILRLTVCQSVSFTRGRALLILCRLAGSESIPFGAAILHVDWLGGRTLGAWHSGQNYFVGGSHNKIVPNQNYYKTFTDTQKLFHFSITHNQKCNNYGATLLYKIFHHVANSSITFQH
jgi:hypothetical protein